MFRSLGFNLSRSQRSIASSSSRTSTYTPSTSASSLPVTVSRSTSLSARRKASSNKYQTVTLFLFALVIFSFAPTLRLSAQTHAEYALMPKSNHQTQKLPLKTAPNQLDKVKVSTLSELSVHRISEVLFELVHNEELASLAVYPCHNHLPILKALSQMLSLESYQVRPQLYCLDSNSAQLEEAHSIIRDEGYAFDVKYIREDATKKPPSKANIFVRIHTEQGSDPIPLAGLLMSVKESGAQVAVVNTVPNKIAKWDVDANYESAPFPLAEHIQLIKSIENGFVVVYDLLNMTQQ